MFDSFESRNFDDLLFEQRNREYGAYQLRRRYNSVMLFSIIISVVIFTLSIVLPFAIKPKDEKVFASGYNYASVDMQNFEAPEQVYVPPAAPPPPPARVQQPVEYVPPVIVDSIVPMDETLPTFEEVAELTPEDERIYSGIGSGDDLFGIDGGIPTDEPFMIVETMPSFRGGGIDRFRDWVQKRTNYPQDAIEKKIKGKVVLTFIVETDGTVSNVTVVHSVDPMLDAEAVKAIEASPKWMPGLQRGKPVRVRYIIPLLFSF